MNFRSYGGIREVTNKESSMSQAIVSFILGALVGIVSFHAAKYAVSQAAGE